MNNATIHGMATGTTPQIKTNNPNNMVPITANPPIPTNLRQVQII